MAYKIIVSPQAQKEIENAIDYYALYSSDAPRNFVTVLKSAYCTLETNPFFRVSYLNIRALKITKFPYSLYFVINETQNTVRYFPVFTIKEIQIKDQCIKTENHLSGGFSVY